VELDDALARDAVKVKAIKHRTLVAQQGLVSVNDLSISKNYSDSQDVETPQLNLHSGTKFLSQQADIEAALLNSISPLSVTATMAAPVDKKDNLISGFLKKLGISCEKSQNKIIAPNSFVSIPQCPNCKAALKPGIQFCLNCQRTLAPPSRPIKLSEAGFGNSFTYHRMDSVDPAEQLIAKNKLQHLRQQKMVALARMHKFLNYALVAAIVIGGIVVFTNYIMRNISWKIPSLATHTNSDITEGDGREVTMPDTNNTSPSESFDLSTDNAESNNSATIGNEKNLENSQTQNALEKTSNSAENEEEQKP
jgi:hypothetical protein